MTTTIAYDQLPDLAGTDLGYTEYRTVTQEQVQLFADATDDQQWIHVDPERAKDGPFGAPIAHGFLTLSLAVPFWTELLEVKGVSTKVNYGLDKVRFPAPVTVGSRVRMRATIAEVVEVRGGYQIAVDQTIEIEGGTKPAVVARGLYRFHA
ncbi:MaoC family dehydratase [Micromonospora endophytica]|uniref:Enoyl-CoA hydratase n=1 Tax=Micromonospora endophytica TaxID=515350 RepID=A0A2W2CMG3_9ACTN|nr:MaoC family dehydratase [Micromonospora endophytica]PZG00702.1 enoyl-CoA hydratase [Micromonospora endophytica]RIW44824.1 MaoC family dehydratase [Micromonospora endophytica]BCJ57551.1 MaoC family dehydratase [Micromonospora endophytica]